MEIRVNIDKPDQNYRLKQGDRGKYIGAVQGADSKPYAIITVDNDFYLVSFNAIELID